MIRHAIESIPKIIKAYAGHRIPLRVTYCVTYRCNLECGYCRRHDIRVKELTTQEALKVISGFAGAGTGFISFNGGEPLLRQDIGLLVDEAKRRGMKTSIATNGQLLSRRVSELASLDAASISLDGGKKIQDEIRDGSYDKAIDGLKALEGSRTRIYLTCVVGKHNIRDLHEVLEVASEYGAKVFFQPIRTQKEDRESAARRYYPTIEQMREAMDYLIKEKKRGRPVASSDIYLAHIRDSWPDRLPPQKCWASRLYCFMTPDGYVTPCCDTLAGPHTPESSAAEHGANAFKSLQTPECEGCYSSIPLESNILFDRLNDPKYLITQALREYLI